MLHLLTAFLFNLLHVIMSCVVGCCWGDRGSLWLSHSFYFFISLYLWRVMEDNVTSSGADHRSAKWKTDVRSLLLNLNCCFFSTQPSKNDSFCHLSDGCVINTCINSKGDNTDDTPCWLTARHVSSLYLFKSFLITQCFHEVVKNIFSNQKFLNNTIPKLDFKGRIVLSYVFLLLWAATDVLQTNWQLLIC